MLAIDLTGKTAFVAGVADDQGFGFAIARSLAEAGAEVYVGTWPPAYSLFVKSMERGKFDESMTLADGRKMEFAGIIPLEAMYDTLDDAPQEIREDKRYQPHGDFSISGAAAVLKEKLAGRKLDVLIHSLANAPEVKNPILETSRKGYLSAMSASSYSLVSLCQHMVSFMSFGGSVVTLSYLASERVIPGYGGGMGSAKAALESDVRALAYECGKAYGVRVNAISAGPYASRAAKAIGFMTKILDYTARNQPLPKDVTAMDVGYVTAFLSSPLAGSVTGAVTYVDNGFHVMGVGVETRGMLEGDTASIHTRPDWKAPE